MFTRRSVLAGSGALLFAPAILRAQTLFTAWPFRLGVAAGDPQPDGFVIWTRLAPDPLAEHGGMPMQAVAVDWEVAADASFKTIVAKGEAVARPELGHAVHVEVEGLQPDRPYWYHFLIGRERSITGRARTMPAAGARVDGLRIGVAGCQNYEDGLYTAYRHMAEEDLAFVFHYGDYIYEGRTSHARWNWNSGPQPLEPVRRHVGQELYDLADYRRRYAQTKLDTDLQAVHAAFAFFPTFDDHEVDNNWTGNHDQDDVPIEYARLRRQAALQAWYEHMPVRRSSIPAGPAIQMYRGARWGDLADFRFLDTRQFRSPQPCGDGFQPVCAGVSDPKAEILGREQESMATAPGRARWTVLAQQVMMMTMDRRTGDQPAPIMNMDTWSAYAVPRARILKALASRGDVVVLTGDEHQNFAGQVRGPDDRPVAVEFVSTSISSGGDGQDLRPGSDRMMANNPHLTFLNDQRGYLVCDIGRDQWRSDFMVMDQVSRPEGRISRRASFVVEGGKPELHRTTA